MFMPVAADQSELCRQDSRMVTFSFYRKVAAGVSVIETAEKVVVNHLAEITTLKIRIFL